MRNLEGRYNTLTFTPTETDVVGISLFTETIDGTVQTTIYQRFKAVPPHHGGRVFARSVDPNEEHHDETVAAWTERADDVRDFRPVSTRTPQGAALLLSGAVGAIRGTTRHGDLTAAWIAEALDSVLTDAERDVLRSTLFKSDTPDSE